MNLFGDFQDVRLMYLKGGLLLVLGGMARPGRHGRGKPAGGKSDDAGEGVRVTDSFRHALVVGLRIPLVLSGYCSSNAPILLTNYLTRPKSGEA